MVGVSWMTARTWVSQVPLKDNILGKASSDFGAECFLLSAIYLGQDIETSRKQIIVNSRLPELENEIITCEMLSNRGSSVHFPIFGHILNKSRCSCVCARKLLVSLA